MDKLKSRKFWVCVAAFLGSIATSISGIVTDNQTITTIGVVCGVVSAAIYAFCEAWVDQASFNSSINVSVDKDASAITEKDSEEEK